MKIFKASIVILIVFSLGAEVALAGFGITPPYIRNQTLTPGSEYTKRITLVRGDPIEDLKAEITMNIPGATGWFSIDRGNEFILPAGENQVPINITVRVPEDADYASYEGNIRIRTSSLEQKSGVSIALGAQIDVYIDVVDKIYDFEVQRVEIQEAEEGYKKWWLDFPGKITFYMHVENTGNAPVAPSKVAFEILDRKSETVLETTESIGSIQKVSAFDTKKVAAYIPTHLKAGGYKVKYSIYKEDAVARTGDVMLTVLPQGVLRNYEPFGFAALSFGDKASIVAPIVGVILLIVGVIVWIIINKKGKSSKRRRTPPGQRSGGAQTSSQEQQNLRSSAPARRAPARVPGRGGNVVDLSRRK